MSFFKYDLEWSDGTADSSIELHCYRYGHSPDRSPLAVAKAKAFHLKNAIMFLFPETLPNGRRGCVQHVWLDMRINDWCNVYAIQMGAPLDWHCWHGPASAGKTADAAVISLADWLSGHDCTTTIVCSTTIKMLKKRIWGEVLRYFRMYGDQLPGAHRKSMMAILDDPDGEMKNGIHGVAIQQGSIEEAMGDLVGVHNDRVRLIIDEAQATREAAFEATDNLKANQEFTLLAMGNPMSHLDPLGRYSEPKKGWGSVSPSIDPPYWRTRFGTVVFFDGRKSPGIKEPKRLPFLLQQKQIDDTARTRGAESPMMYTFRIGFCPPEGLLHTVITESMLVKFMMMEGAVWKSPPQRAAGLDPAFSNGGDRCILQPIEYGELVTGQIAIFFMPYINIKLALAPDKPITYHIQERVQEECTNLGIASNALAIDCSGTQGTLADVIEKEWAPGVHRVLFQGNASDHPVSREDPTPGKKAYANRVTELWFRLSSFARYNQIRGFSRDAATEATQRIVVEDKMPQMIETKRKMKSRVTLSPDVTDAGVVALDWIIERAGIFPGEGITFTANDEDAMYREYDVDGHELYAAEPF